MAAQVHHLGDEATFPGRRRAGQILDQLPSAEPYPLTKPLLTAQLSSGVWGGYRRVDRPSTSSPALGDARFDSRK